MNQQLKVCNSPRSCVGLAHIANSASGKMHHYSAHSHVWDSYSFWVFAHAQSPSMSGLVSPSLNVQSMSPPPVWPDCGVLAALRSIIPYPKLYFVFDLPFPSSSPNGRMMILHSPALSCWILAKSVPSTTSGLTPMARFFPSGENAKASTL
jgi:hypothetical protein